MISLLIDVDLHHCTDDNNVIDEEDIHICITYQTDEQVLGYKSTRANRFYLIHDPVGSKVGYLAGYHKTLADIEVDGVNIAKHMFAGYQYMESEPKYDTRSKFMEIEQEWIQLKQKHPEDVIHVELAHFNKDHTLHYMMKYLFNNTDSVGLNEQEIYTLLNQYIYYENIENPNSANTTYLDLKESRIQPIDSIRLIYKLVTKYLEKLNPSISRIQYHTLGHMVTCYDPNIWESAVDSLFRAGLTSILYCEDLANTSSKSLCDTHSFKKLDLAGLDDTMTIIPSNSTYSGTEDFMAFYKINNSKFICGAISTPTCNKPKKLTGLGDNISSTGFVYHNRKSE